jgi:hypothetical protein
VIAEFALREAEPAAAVPLQVLLGGHPALFDRLIQVMSEEYRQEAGRRLSEEERHAERVRRLLGGELIDASEFLYDFDGYHLGGIGSGRSARKLAHLLARQLDRRLLLIEDEEEVWVWFGGRTPPSVAEALRLARECRDSGCNFSFGEAAQGLEGWRATHIQARRAFTVVQKGGSGVVRYADVALLASALDDWFLWDSLRSIYLAPLDADRDGGQVARETLQAYFSSDRNISSAAALLEVKRHTVTRRLRAIEDRTGRSLAQSSSELDLALQIEGLYKRSTSLPWK